MYWQSAAAAAAAAAVAVFQCMQIEAANAVLIFDEAHNIEDQARLVVRGNPKLAEHGCHCHVL